MSGARPVPTTGLEAPTGAATSLPSGGFHRR